ncbi:unnamed protein product [Aspergillus oryzae var. brunneus]|uniref:Unnamed protein product n=1 Tax=Aspergillus oryzae var. brunneus TaxID=332754 RepID=A0ABQ6LJC1_ASPOZ|nr:unnamed protein product [Aspergillus oryzae var. brunneus]
MVMRRSTRGECASTVSSPVEDMESAVQNPCFGNLNRALWTKNLQGLECTTESKGQAASDGEHIHGARTVAVAWRSHQLKQDSTWAPETGMLYLHC